VNQRLPSLPAAIPLTLARPQPSQLEPGGCGSGSAYSITPPDDREARVDGDGDPRATWDGDWDAGRTNGPFAVQPVASRMHIASAARI
jgi:hypothetical protein